MEKESEKEWKGIRKRKGNESEKANKTSIINSFELHLYECLIDSSLQQEPVLELS